MSTGKGQKRVKNTPVLYNEIKKQRGLMLTPTAWEKLCNTARHQDISVSELVERMARGLDG
ncbi:MAG: hypothetical protein AAFW70_28085 [Cyanobacteria bacterium J06635_10]